MAFAASAPEGPSSITYARSPTAGNSASVRSSRTEGATSPVAASFGASWIIARSISFPLPDKMRALSRSVAGMKRDFDGLEAGEIDVAAVVAGGGDDGAGLCEVRANLNKIGLGEVEAG